MASKRKKFTHELSSEMAEGFRDGIMSEAKRNGIRGESISEVIGTLVDKRIQASSTSVNAEVVDLLDDSSVSLRRIDQTLDDIHDVLLNPSENGNAELIEESKRSSSVLTDILKQLKLMNETTKRHDRAREEERLEQNIQGQTGNSDGFHSDGPESDSSGGLGSMLKGVGLGSIGLLLKPIKLISKMFGSLGEIGKLTAPISKMLSGKGNAGFLGVAKRALFFVNMIFSAFEGIVDFFDTTDIAEKLGKNKEDVNLLDRALNGISGFVSRFFGNLIQPFLDWFGIDFNLEEFMLGGFGYIQKGISDSVTSLSKVNPSDVGKNLWESLKEMTSKMVGLLLQPVMDFFGVDIDVTKSTSEMFKKIGSGIDSMLETVSEKGLVGYLEGVWDSVVESIKFGVDSIANEIAYSVTDTIDSMIVWLKNQPWVPDFIADSLPETYREEKAAAQLEYDRVVAKVETANNELPTAQKELDDVSVSLRASLDANEQKYATRRAEMKKNKAYAGAYEVVDRDEQAEREQIISHHAKLYDERKARVDQLTVDKNIEIPTNPRDIDDRTGQKVNVPPVVSAASISGLEGRILDMVGDKESKGNYNALVYGNGSPKTADLVNMTIDEVYDFQSKMKANGHASTAVGKYQFIHGTLNEAVNAIGLSGSDKFSPENQDKLALYLLKKRGIEKYKRGEITKEEFANRLSKEWASLPKSNGKSSYEGIAGNKAGMGYDTLISTIEGVGLDQPNSTVLASNSVPPVVLAENSVPPTVSSNSVPPVVLAENSVPPTVTAGSPTVSSNSVPPVVLAENSVPPTVTAGSPTVSSNSVPLTIGATPIDVRTVSSGVVGKGGELVSMQREQSNVDVAVAQAPVQVQTINNVNQKSQEKISVALRNDEPSFRKVIERLAANSLGIAGSPLMAG